MITFKQFLAEKAFNKSVYAQTMKKVQGALVGYEIEAYIHGEHEFSSENEPKGTYVMIRGFDTMTEFEETFSISRADHISIENAYGAWLAEKEDEYVDENWRDHYDDAVEEEDGRKEAESQARATARDSFDKKDFGWSEWFHDEFNNAYAFIQEYGLEPKYGWEAESGKTSTVFTEEPQFKDNGWDISAAEQVGAELENILGSPVVVKSITGGDNKTWMIVPDSSIEKDSDDDRNPGSGIEIVSPPQPPEKALQDLKAVFKFMKREGIETNKSTGIHVNISIPNIYENLDPVKLVLFMGDEYVLKGFDRLGNSMSRPHMTAIVRSIQTHGTLPRSAQELIDLAQEALDKGKYRSVNFGKLSDGYLEFRAAGNSDYHQRFDDIEEITGRWLTAIAIACDPNAERNEYLKKFTKLMGRAIQVPGEHEAKEMSVLDVFRKKVPEQGAWLNRKDKGSNVKGLASIGATFGNTFSPSFKQIKELRAFLADRSISATDILQYAEKNPESVALNFSASHLENLKLFLRTFKLR